MSFGQTSKQNSDGPREVDNFCDPDSCLCEACGAKLARVRIWIWFENICCSKACAIVARERNPDDATVKKTVDLAQSCEPR